MEHGCIIFSQYYDTVRTLAAELAKTLPGEPVAIYAGAGKSGIYRDADFASVEREHIKAAVKKREIRLLVATDAACEGLNLQTLGTLSNLVYHETQDEKVYGVLSRRMKNRYDIFGGLPETIDPDRDRWELCSRVFSRRDIVDKLSAAW